MVKKIGKGIFVGLCILISLYPVAYYLGRNDFGILTRKSNALLADFFFNTGFYAHITFGGVGLLVGWLQFNKKIQTNHISLHRTIGKIYVIAVFIGAMTGIYIGLYAAGGLIPSLGFISLGSIWLLTTLSGYVQIRSGEILKHRQMMYYSFGACFAAVTLRIWMPLLQFITGDFITAYRIVAWLCWVPNMIFVYFITKKLKTTVPDKGKVSI